MAGQPQRKEDVPKEHCQRLACLSSGALPQKEWLFVINPTRNKQTALQRYKMKQCSCESLFWLLLKARNDILVTQIISQRNKWKHFSTLIRKTSLGEALTYWSDVETLMPYLETPIINSSSPGTKGNFPSCFGGKQTKAFSADRRTWTMKIHNRKYVYLGPLDQHHCKPCSDSAVCGLPTAHALTQSLNVMWNILGGD